jgi:hypothetical protein
MMTAAAAQAMMYRTEQSVTMRCIFDHHCHIARYATTAVECHQNALCLEPTTTNRLRLLNAILTTAMTSISHQCLGITKKHLLTQQWQTPHLQGPLYATKTRTFHPSVRVHHMRLKPKLVEGSMPSPSLRLRPLTRQMRRQPLTRCRADLKL